MSCNQIGFENNNNNGTGAPLLSCRFHKYYIDYKDTKMIFDNILFSVTFCTMTCYNHSLEKDKSHTCLYTRHYITLLIRMISVYALSFVLTPLSHSRQRGKRRPFETTHLSDYAEVRGVTEQEWEWHIQIQHDCLCNNPRFYACLPASLAYHSNPCVYKIITYIVHRQQLSEQVNL